MEMIVATNAELTAENLELRTRIAELEAATPGGPPAAVLPSFGLSEGTRVDILEAQNRLRVDPKVAEMVLVEPFVGRRIRVTEDSYELLESANPEPGEPAPPAQD